MTTALLLPVICIYMQIRTFNLKHPELIEKLLMFPSEVVPHQHRYNICRHVEYGSIGFGSYLINALPRNPLPAYLFDKPDNTAETNIPLIKIPIKARTETAAPAHITH